MSFFREYAKDIVTVCIIMIIFENILPTQKYKKYIKSAMSLIIMLSILKPISVISDCRSMILNIPDFESYEEYELSSDILTESLTKDTENKIKDEIKAFSKTDTDISVRFKTDENGNPVDFEEILISPLNEEIKLFVSEKFGINSEQIHEKQR